MPRIIDNIEVGLAEDLRAEIARGAVRLDAAIGYFNLRGWRELADAVDDMPRTQGSPKARILIGMASDPP